uniref:Uncharacterized protein n=1 Tax=Monopterus albus TaxID=43700 RepID=A0A3Q3J446_MONAL
MLNVAAVSLIQAVTHEIQRVSIPRGTVIIPNLSSVLFEEGQWKSPHVFNPENFLNDKQEFLWVFQITGQQMCLGEGLAHMELFLTVVTLLRKFTFIWPEDAGEPDFTPLFGLTQTPKPFHMKIQRRGNT